MQKFAWGGMDAEFMPVVTGQVLRRFVSGEKMTVARVEFLAGSEVEEHSHDNEQFAVVLSGTMVFTVAGEKVTINAGELIHLPSGVPHSARAENDAVLLDVFSPPRADWNTEPDPLEPRD